MVLVVVVLGAGGVLAQRAKRNLLCEKQNPFVVVWTSVDRTPDFTSSLVPPTLRGLAEDISSINRGLKYT
jgi:hypothetical protein